MGGSGGVVEALIEEGAGFLAGGDVVLEADVVESKDRLRGGGVFGGGGEEWAGSGRGELFELANAGIRSLPDGEIFAVGREVFAQGFYENFSDVVLGGALGEELEDDEVLVTIGDDSREVIGFCEDEAEGVGVWSDDGAEAERGFDAGA